MPDLLIAAAAEVNGVAVIHYDANYERITQVTSSSPNAWYRTAYLDAMIRRLPWSDPSGRDMLRGPASTPSS